MFRIIPTYYVQVCFKQGKKGHNFKVSESQLHAFFKVMTDNNVFSIKITKPTDQYMTHVKDGKGHSQSLNEMTP